MYHLKVNGKVIQRSQYTQNIQDNARRIAQSGQLYKKRQALVEHPYGTIKRQWGFDHIMTKKGISAASADFGLIALAYNLRRLFNSKSNLNQLIIALFLSFKALIKSYIKPKKGYTAIRLKKNRIITSFVFNNNFNYF